MKSCSGLSRLLTQIRAMVPAHSLVTNTDCPSRSQAPLAALWKDLVVGRALSRKWGPLRFRTEMTGVTESCKAKSASPESQTLSSRGSLSSQGDLAHPCYIAVHPLASHWLPGGAPWKPWEQCEKKGAISHGRGEARVLLSPHPPHAPVPVLSTLPKRMPFSPIPTRAFLAYRMVVF